MASRVCRCGNTIFRPELEILNDFSRPVICTCGREYIASCEDADENGDHEHYLELTKDIEE